MALAVAPGLAVCVPPAHGWHVVAPSDGAKKSAGHTSHAASGSPGTPLLPGGHGTQAAPLQALPTTHSWHMPLLIAPVLAVCVPTAQGWHTVAPMNGLKKSTAHSSHTATPASSPPAPPVNTPLVPRSQLWQNSALYHCVPTTHGKQTGEPVLGAIRPTGHATQLAARAAGPYSPAGHGEHCVAPSPEKVPDGHTSGLDAPARDQVPAGVGRHSVASLENPVYDPAAHGVHAPSLNADV